MSTRFIFTGSFFFFLFLFRSVDDFNHGELGSNIFDYFFNIFIIFIISILTQINFSLPKVDIFDISNHFFDLLYQINHILRTQSQFHETDFNISQITLSLVNKETLQQFLNSSKGDFRTLEQTQRQILNFL